MEGHLRRDSSNPQRTCSSLVVLRVLHGPTNIQQDRVLYGYRHHDQRSSSDQLDKGLYLCPYKQNQVRTIRHLEYDLLHHTFYLANKEYSLLISEHLFLVDTSQLDMVLEQKCLLDNSFLQDRFEHFLLTAWLQWRYLYSSILRHTTRLETDLCQAMDSVYLAHI